MQTSGEAKHANQTSEVSVVVLKPSQQPRGGVVVDGLREACTQNRLLQWGRWRVATVEVGGREEGGVDGVSGECSEGAWVVEKRT